MFLSKYRAGPGRKGGWMRAVLAWAVGSFLLIGSWSTAHGQKYKAPAIATPLDVPEQHVLYMELLGTVSPYSLNYERAMLLGDSIRAWSRIGASYSFSGGLFVPLTVKAVIGAENGLSLEAGSGLLAALESGREPWVRPTATLGVRYRTGVFILRAGFTPNFDGERLFLRAGLSGGIAF